MAHQRSARSKSVPVALATVITQYRCVRMDSNGEAVNIAAVGNMPIGIALESSTSSQDEAISVALLDGAVLQIEAGATLAAGATAYLRADGRAGTTSSGATILGTVREGGSAGDIIVIDSGSLPTA